MSLRRRALDAVEGDAHRLMHVVAWLQASQGEATISASKSVTTPVTVPQRR